MTKEDLNTILIALEYASANYPNSPEKFQQLKEEIEKIKTLYDIDKIKLPPKYDRRRKLMDKDYEDIKKMYADGFTQGEIARKYNVCKSTIERVLNPNIKVYRRKYNSEHWRDFYNQEDYYKRKKERKLYKRDLYRKGLIELDK